MVGDADQTGEGSAAGAVGVTFFRQRRSREKNARPLVRQTLFAEYRVNDPPRIRHPGETSVMPPPRLRGRNARRDELRSRHS